MVNLDGVVIWTFIDEGILVEPGFGILDLARSRLKVVVL